jgi:hypothetical protein
MARAKPGTVQIRSTMLDAEGLSPRVAVIRESIQNKFMMQVISSMKMEVEKRIQTNDLTLFLLTCKITAILYLIMTSK